jgi:uncharacterized protein (TIGR00369 family)
MSSLHRENVEAAIENDDIGNLRRALETSPLAEALGIAFTELRPGHATATLRPGALLVDFRSRVHTGAVFALAEQTMSAAANSLGHVGLPLSCEIEYLEGAAPDAELSADAHVVDTQNHIARVVVEVSQSGTPVARLTEKVYLREARERCREAAM